MKKPIARSFIAPSLLILAPLLLLWRCVFLGETIGPWAEVRSFSPWSETPPNRPFDVLQMDAALQFYVWRDLVFDSWRHFQIPWWNPYSLGGSPLLANSQSGALYPPHILVGILQIPTSAGVTLLAWFHLSLAGWGIYALGRRLGGEEWVACLGGVSFSLSAFMISWSGLASVISTVAWIPWCLWALARGLHPGSPQSRQPFVLLAFFVAMMLLAGHLQFAAFGVMALLVFWLVGSWEFRPHWKQALRPAISLVIGILLASPQLMAVLQYSQMSHRRAAPTIDGWSAYQSSGLKWWEWASVGSGDLLGSPSRWAPGHVSSFWPALVKPGSNYAESAVTVGAVALILGFASFFQRRPGAWSLGAVALIGVLIASASPLAKALYFGFPGWSATGSPGRAGVLFVLGLCALASTFNPSSQQGKERPWHWFVGTAVALAGAGSIFVFASSLSTWIGISQEQFQAVFWAQTSGFFGAALIVMSAGGILWLRHCQSKHFPQACTFFGAAILIPGLLSAPLRSGTLPPVPQGLVPEARVAIVNQHWSLFSQPKALMPPNLAALFRIREVGGYDSLISRDQVEHLKVLNGGVDPAPPENGNMMFIKDPSRITKADADEIWTISPMVGWENRFLGRVGSAFRYRTEGLQLSSP